AMPPLIAGRVTPLKACLEQDEQYLEGYAKAAGVRDLYENNEDAKRVIDAAVGLEGLRRQDGVHASAIVITDEPIINYVPVQRKPSKDVSFEDAPLVTQYEGHGVEDLGLLKMDFLGLRNLDII